MDIRLPKKLAKRIHKHGENGYPEEVCGALIGKYDNNVFIVEDVVSMQNINTVSPRTRYTIDPLELITLEDEMERKGMELLGFYHSHPDHPSVPSRIDHEQAWPNLSYLVLSVINGEAKLLTSWRLKTTSATLKGDFEKENIILYE